MKPILVAADLSPRGAAVQRRGAVLARATSAPLELFHVLGRYAGEPAARSARARLQLAAANLRDNFGVEVRVALARGRVAAAIASRRASSAPTCWCSRPSARA